MKTFATTTLVAMGLALAAAPSFAADAGAGEKTFKKCKSCHMIQNGDDTIFRGGKTGPNLYGIIGRTAGTVDGFRYGDDLVAAGEKGLVWTEENLAEYVADPKEFLRTYLDDGKAKSKMSYKLRKGGDDVAAYLASVAQ
ncbi:c-type cytochrome [Rhodovulum sp. DZ06]|uniref:c-type cytochrome n=1 Tax=Rhodovulum sp. DZ06 TaxID=3425126 RepID=UPI003D332A67